MVFFANKNRKQDFNHLLTRSHIRISVIGGVFLLLGLLLSIYQAVQVKKLVFTVGPIQHSNMIIRSELNNSLANLRGWTKLPDEYFRQGWEDSWQKGVTPALKALFLNKDFLVKEKLNEIVNDINHELIGLKESQWWVLQTANTPGNEPAKVLYLNEIIPLADNITMLLDSFDDYHGYNTYHENDKNRILLFELQNFFSTSILILEKFILTGDIGQEEKLYSHIMLFKKKKFDFFSGLQTNEFFKIKKYLDSEFKAFETSAAEAIKIRKSAKWNIANFLMETETIPISRQVFSLISKLSTHIENLVNDADKSAQRAGNGSIFALLTLLLILPIIAYFTAKKQAQKLSLPIMDLEKTTKKFVRDGKMATFEITGPTEIVNLGHSFNTMCKNLQKSQDKLVRQEKLVSEVEERKRSEKKLIASEERYRSIFENIQDVYYEASMMDGTITEVSPSIENISGYKRKDVIGKSIYDIYSNPEEKDELLKTLLNSGKIANFEVQLRDKDDSQNTVELNATLRWNQKGNPSKIIGSMRDITDRKQLEALLQQSQKMESIGTLAGGIAHDFNNIMAIILGNTELALDDVPKWNSAHSSLEEIKTASLRAKNIVKQLLSFSRKTDQKLQPIQIALVIKEALKFLRSTIPTTINIHQDIPTTEETILANPTQINQIIMNLCINASHAMEQTGGDLNVTVTKIILDNNSARNYPDLKSGGHVKIMVSDTGPGIDHKIIDQIFDPYFTTKEVGKGSGMGLAVVHGIVKSHSGAIAVDSSLGKGTKFSILFPLVTEKPVVKTQTDKDIPRGNETILFVDDEISITKMVKRMFERLGYKIETSTTSLDALELFRSNPDHFDLVITDMTMPQMTGVQLSEKLKDIRKDIPIIVCTGHSTLVNEKKAKELGLAAYVMKPIGMQKTAQTIRKVLDKK